jgi:hypothetical protein
VGPEELPKSKCQCISEAEVPSVQEAATDTGLIACSVARRGMVVVDSPLHQGAAQPSPLTPCIRCWQHSLCIVPLDVKVRDSEPCFQLPFCGYVTGNKKGSWRRPRLQNVCCMVCGFTSDMDSYLKKRSLHFASVTFDSSVTSQTDTEELSITSDIADNTLHCSPSENEAFVAPPQETYVSLVDLLKASKEGSCRMCAFKVRVDWKFCPNCGVYMDDRHR